MSDARAELCRFWGFALPAGAVCADAAAEPGDVAATLLKCTHCSELLACILPEVSRTRRGDHVFSTNCECCRFITEAAFGVLFADEDHLKQYIYRKIREKVMRLTAWKQEGRIWISFGNGDWRGNFLARHRKTAHIMRYAACGLTYIPSSVTISSSLIKTWMSSCEDTLCKPTAEQHSADPRQGTDGIRLIDVIDRCIVDASYEVEFAALSYVWGVTSDKPDRLLTSNMLAFRQNGALGGRETIAKTVYDAIEVTRQVGLRYLFIDRLCIIQDDPRDVAFYVESMDRVYSRASFTIFATSGQDADAGLPGCSGMPREHENLLPPRHAFAVSSDSELVSTMEGEVEEHLSLLDHYIEQSVWATRAWTLQEGLLSWRRLIFTDNIVMWQCNHTFQYENGLVPLADYRPIRSLDSSPWGFDRKSSLLPRFKAVDRQTTDRAIERYFSLASSYSLRELTFSEDADRAFEGILWNLRTHLPSLNPHYSVFTNRLPWMLQWHCLDYGSHLDGSDMLPRRHPFDGSSESRFPSWAWLSREGGVGWNRATNWATAPCEALTSDIFAWTTEGFEKVYHEGREPQFPLGPVQVPAWASTHHRRRHALIFRALVKRYPARHIAAATRASPKDHVGPCFANLERKDPEEEGWSDEEWSDAEWADSQISSTGEWRNEKQVARWLKRSLLPQADRDIGLVCFSKVPPAEDTKVKFRQCRWSWSLPGLFAIMIVSFVDAGDGEMAFREGLFWCMPEKFLAAKDGFTPETLFLC